MEKKLTFTLFFLVGFVISLWANSSFVGYAPTRIAIKLSYEALQEVDFSQLDQGKTGLAAIDNLSSKYQVKKLVRHFRSVINKPLNEQTYTLAAWLKVYFPEPVDVEAVAQEYGMLAEIVKAEPIPINRMYATPDDPDYVHQWHLNKSNDADVDAPEAWDIETGDSTIIVGVLDSGVRWYHKDLAGSNANGTDRYSIGGNIWINWAEMNNTDSGVDEDGNGYADDWVGWDFVDDVNPWTNYSGEDYDTPDNNPKDFNGHGTHCAGNVAAVNNNNRGVSAIGGGWGEDANGRSSGIRIMCLRIGYSDKAPWDSYETGYVGMDFAASAFDYARENGARIASCSWGSSSYTPLADALDLFIYDKSNPTSSDPKVRLVFNAAGNDGSDSPDYMSDRGDIISVAATTSSDDATDFTNYGDWVDISAPGNNIYSTYHDHTNPSVDDYATLSGTSMACPIAAGSAGLVWSHDVDLVADSVESYLYEGAESIEDNLDATHKGKMGAGRVSAYNSLLLVPVTNTPPVAVDDNATTPEDTAVVIDVLANDSDDDGDELTITGVTQPANGTVVNNGTDVTYTPDADYYGTDQFDYYISDGNGGADTATVTVTVESRNDPPQIVGLPDTLVLETNSCTGLKMEDYAQDVDTPYSLLSWTFSVSDPAITADYDETTDTLTICAGSTTGTFYVFVTLTDDSGATDQDTIQVDVEEPNALPSAGAGMPQQFVLYQNYPNPFGEGVAANRSSATIIRYGLPMAAQVSVAIYNVKGQKIAELQNGHQQAGYHSLNFSGRNLSSGIYFIKIQAGKFTAVRKMMFIK